MLERLNAEIGRLQQSHNQKKIVAIEPTDEIGTEDLKPPELVINKTLDEFRKKLKNCPANSRTDLKNFLENLFEVIKRIKSKEIILKTERFRDNVCNSLLENVINRLIELKIIKKIEQVTNTHHQIDNEIESDDENTPTKKAKKNPLEVNNSKYTLLPMIRLNSIEEFIDDTKSLVSTITVWKLENRDLHSLTEFVDKEGVKLNSLAEKRPYNLTEIFKALQHSNLKDLLENITNKYPWTKNFTIRTNTQITNIHFFEINLSDLKMAKNTNTNAEYFETKLKDIIYILMNTAGFIPDYGHMIEILNDYLDFGIIIIATKKTLDLKEPELEPIGIVSGNVVEKKLKTKGVYVHREYQEQQLSNALIYLLNNSLFNNNFNSSDTHIILQARSPNPSVIFKFPNGLQPIVALHKLANRYNKLLKNPTTLKTLLNLQLTQPDLSSESSQEKIERFYEIINHKNGTEKNYNLQYGLYKLFIKVVAGDHFITFDFDKTTLGSISETFKGELDNFISKNKEYLANEDQLFYESNELDIHKRFNDLFVEVKTAYRLKKIVLSQYKLLALACVIWDYLESTKQYKINEDDIENILKKYVEKFNPNQHYLPYEKKISDDHLGLSQDESEQTYSENDIITNFNESDIRQLCQFLNSLVKDTKTIFKDHPDNYFAFGYSYIKKNNTKPISLSMLSQINRRASFPFNSLNSSPWVLALSYFVAQIYPGNTSRPFTQSDITNSMLSQLCSGAYSKLEKKLPIPFFLNILDHYLPKQQINDSTIFILLEEALEKVLVILTQLQPINDASEIIYREACCQLDKSISELTKFSEEENNTSFPILLEKIFDYGVRKRHVLLKQPSPITCKVDMHSDVKTIWGQESNQDSSKFIGGRTKKTQLISQCLKIIWKNHELKKSNDTSDNRKIFNQYTHPIKYVKNQFDEFFRKQYQTSINFNLDNYDAFKHQFRDKPFHPNYIDKHPIWPPELLGNIFLVSSLYERLKAQTIPHHPRGLGIVKKINDTKKNDPTYDLVPYYIEDDITTQLRTTSIFILYENETYQQLEHKKINSEIAKEAAQDYSHFLKLQKVNLLAIKQNIKPALANYFRGLKPNEFRKKRAGLIQALATLNCILKHSEKTVILNPSNDTKGSPTVDKIPFENIFDAICNNSVPDFQSLIRHILSMHKIAIKK